MDIHLSTFSRKEFFVVKYESVNIIKVMLLN